MPHTETYDHLAIFWQDGGIGAEIPEAALCLRLVNQGELIELQQENRHIIINVGSLGQFIKALRHISKSKAPK